MKKIITLLLTFFVCILICSCQSKEEKLEARYNEMVSAYQNGNFEDSYDDLAGYKDRVKYYYYRQAHKTWDFNNDVGAYGTTIENLKEASGILDADEKLKLISDLSSEYNGTWQYKGEYTDYYIYIKDGKVARELDYDGSPVGYFYDLVRVTFDDEAVKKFLGDNNSSVDTTPKTHIIGSCSYDGEIDKDYLFMNVENNQMFAFDISDEPYNTFNGLYTKISEDVPPEI